ncbi:hypothetical protein NA57DRAFT_52007 [Rhizodiscina lignyota]|uniref:Uncharacterized protein n=1 Tax=Rhizodiscina lignyota TaxID=1504668 RepID=A0A9P4MEB1_9PEZI|nr:hypothetical protein NA57DRAFT_52007 [Rhizodiscina lignyota]
MSSSNMNNSGAEQVLPDYASEASVPLPTYNAPGSLTVQGAQHLKPKASHKPSHQTTPEERLKMLQEFADEKIYANDNYGGHKGAASQWQVHDPSLMFQRVGQILRRGDKHGEQKVDWHTHRQSDDGDRNWTVDGYKQEVARGDNEGRKVV